MVGLHLNNIFLHLKSSSVFLFFYKLFENLLKACFLIHTRDTKAEPFFYSTLRKCMFCLINSFDRDKLVWLHNKYWYSVFIVLKMVLFGNRNKNLIIFLGGMEKSNIGYKLQLHCYLVKICQCLGGIIL